MPNTHDVTVPEYMPMLGDLQPSYLLAGGLPSVPVSSTTLAAFATTAYVNEDNIFYPVIQASHAVGPLNSGNGTYWLAVHRNTASSVASWTRQGGTHYLWYYDATPPTPPQTAPLMPTTPDGCLIFGRITVAGGVITDTARVARLRGTTGLPPFNPADLGFSPSASAATNTAALQAVADAQAALSIEYQPTSGVTTPTLPEIQIPDGHYHLDAQVTFAANAVIRGLGNPILEQDTAGEGIFLLNNAYRAEVHNLTFVAGTRQLSWLNSPSNDTSYLRVKDCEFQYATDTAVWQLGTQVITAPSVSTTLAADADAGDTVITVASETGLDSEGDIVLVNDVGEYFHSRWQSNSGTSITLRYGLPSHWTGARKASSGNAVRRGVCTQNTFTKIEDCWFMLPKRAVESVGETTTVSDCWVYVSNTNFTALTPVFLSFGTRLNLYNLLGVPTMGLTYGGDRLNGVRWIDNYLYTTAKDCRFGGEQGGIVPCYNFGTYNPSTPYNGTCGVKFEDCELAFGLAGGPEGNNVALYCATGFPQRVHISGARAYQRSGPWIELSSGTNWTTYFSTAEGIAGVTFSIYIDDDEGEYTSIPTVDDKLYRYMHMHTAPVVLGHLGTEPVPTPLADSAYLWASDINGAGTSGFTLMDELSNLYRIGPGVAGAGAYFPRFSTVASLATSSTGTTSLVDFATLTLQALGSFGVWLLSVSGNPNGAGSGDYRKAYLGALTLFTGNNGAAVTSYLNLVDLATPAPPNIADLTPSVAFYNGSAEVAGATGVAALSASYYLRVKVAGYAGTVGLSQIVSLTRLQ